MAMTEKEKETIPQIVKAFLCLSETKQDALMRIAETMRLQERLERYEINAKRDN